MLDAIIVAAVILGLLMGWSRGLLRPLVVESGVVGAGWYLWAHPRALDLVPPGVPRPIVVSAILLTAGIVLAVLAGAVAGAVFRVLPGAAGADRLAGVIAHTAVALVAVYVLLVGLVTVDRSLASLHAAERIGPAQLAPALAAVRANPQLQLLISPASLSGLEAQARTAPIPAVDLSQADPTVGIYEHDIHPALVDSRLGRIVVAYGERLPYLGRHVAYPAPAGG